MNDAYYIWKDSQARGPYISAQMLDMYEKHEISLLTLCARKEGGPWEPLEQYLSDIRDKAAKTTPSKPGGYYVLQGDKTEGPFTENQLRALWQSGKLNLKTMYAVEGQAEWRPLADMLGILEPNSSAPTQFPNKDEQIVTVRKSRGVFIVLGLLFGLVGFHNFYAGRHGIGALQLIITVLLCWTFIVPMFVALWALVEIITVTQDANGVQMT